MNKSFGEYSPNYTVFDLETTGLSIESDSIVEISAVRIRDRKIAAKFSTLVNPARHIPIEASSVNHITDEMVTTAADISDALQEFINFIGSDTLVGHNIDSFDMKLICRDAKQRLGMDITNDYVDTVLIARKKLSHLSSRSLETLSKYYQVPYKGAHRGLQDSLINYHVYEHLIWTPVPESEVAPRKCPMCGAPMKLRFGAYGKFFGCSNYPACKGTANL